jgi:hypothetical protein
MVCSKVSMLLVASCADCHVMNPVIARMDKTRGTIASATI